MNGIVSSNIYLARDKPGYKIGHAVVLGYLIVFLLGGSILQTLFLRAENKARLAGKRDHWVERKSHDEIELLGDRRYVFSFLSCLLRFWLILSLDLISYTSPRNCMYDGC